MKTHRFVKLFISTLAFVTCAKIATAQSAVAAVYAGEAEEYVSLPVVGIKTNLVYDATSTINLGVEVGLTDDMTLDFSANYNPWTLSDGRKFRHWLLQPEYRYWPDRRFHGHFFGGHLFYGQYNVAKIKMLGTEHGRHQGHLYGFGFSYGYQWTLGRHWNLEATAGIGYAHLKYDRYDCRNCNLNPGTKFKNYFGPTKVGISIIYLIK